MAPAVALAYLGSGAVHPASSASSAHHSGLAPRDGQVQKPHLAGSRETTFGIAFFGDSVSVGAGASDRRHGYVARVSRWLHTHGKRVVETVHAKGGVPVAYWVWAPMPTQLDAAVVELGTNDVRLGTPSARFAQEYRTLTGRIVAANPKAQLLCLSVWSRRGGASLENVINAQIRAACPGTYVDLTGLRHRPFIRSGDGFHPNNAGYRLIARAVLSQLKTS
jgi:lysophospholipase L1-like esterase